MKKILVASILAALAAPAFAYEPLAVLAQEGTTITLYSDACALAGAPKNLPGKATWVDASGKSFAACYGVFLGSLVVIYSDDATIAPIPARLFSRAAGT